MQLAAHPAKSSPCPSPPSLSAHHALPLQTCSGAVACQLMDALHPDVINMSKVDFNLKNDYEFVRNYKELQKAFTECHIDKVCTLVCLCGAAWLTSGLRPAWGCGVALALCVCFAPRPSRCADMHPGCPPQIFHPTALSKGKLQDNQEFMQWFYGYWQQVTGGLPIEDYDPIARRQLCRSGDWKKVRAAAAAQQAGARPLYAVLCLAAASLAGRGKAMEVGLAAAWRARCCLCWALDGHSAGAKQQHPTCCRLCSSRWALALASLPPSLLCVAARRPWRRAPRRLLLPRCRCRGARASRCLGRERPAGPAARR